MATYKANRTFWHGGIQTDKGKLVDSSHELVGLYPSYFTIETLSDVNAAGTLTADLHWAGTLGPVLRSAGGSLYRLLVSDDGGTITAGTAS